jgi:four helix bundle protein
VTPQELRERTTRFGGRVRQFCRPYLRDIDTYDAARQFTRASASVGSVYRSVCLSRSHAEFVARIAHVLEETDEALQDLRSIAQNITGTPSRPSTPTESKQGDAEAARSGMTQ